MKTIKSRFEKRYIQEPNTGCWLWTGTIRCKFGYGCLYKGNKRHLAHRVSWELYRGEIPKGLCVLHKCDVPSCVNPDHLFLGTPKDNAVDRQNKNRGIQHKGSRHGAAKLTETDVINIRKDTRKRKEIAKEYNVHLSLIYYIINGKIWRHVK